MAQPYVSIIVPAYNEAERIPQALTSMDKLLADAPYSYEILVVNDGSTDKTADIVNNMAAKMIRNLKLIDLKVNHGKGSAVRQGILLAAGKIRLFTDADNSTSIDQFEAMMPFFKQGYEAVIGSRAIAGAKLEPAEGPVRQAFGKVGNIFFQLVLGLWGIWDTQCGFKAFTEEAAERIFKVARVDGWGFDGEALALAKKEGYKIKEIPVRWVNDTRSHVRPSAYIEVLIETLRVRWWLWRGGYESPAQKDPLAQNSHLK